MPSMPMYILAALLLASSAARGAGADDVMTLGRSCASDFHQGRHDAMWARMTPALHAAIGTRDTLADLQRKVAQDLGAEKTVLSERTESNDAVRSYIREAEFSRSSTRATLHCVFDPQDRISGFEIRPVQPAPTLVVSAHMDYQTQARLQLPFEGEWYTVWGGRTIEQNYHAASPDQRFAYDFLVVRDGRTYTGDRTQKENYHCWNQKISAPAAGTVVVARDGLPDNVPGMMDRANPLGNHVIVDLGNGEFALLGHLRQASIVVKLGDRVTAGQEIGRCGNSGNTSEPHLHFHLQNTGEFGQGEGLPAFFNDYLANGVPVLRGEPVRGQVIRRR